MTPVPDLDILSELESAVLTQDDSSPAENPALRKRLRRLRPILDAQPEGVQGPRLTFALGRTVCTVPIEKQITVGRKGEDLDLAIPNPKLSRRHFLLRRTEEGCVLEDLDSHNGTEVNDVTTDTCVLVPGDSIRAGDLEFFYLEDQGD